LKKSNTSISDASNAQLSIKTYYLKSLKNALRVRIGISLKFTTLKMAISNVINLLILSQSAFKLMNLQTSHTNLNSAYDTFVYIK